MQAHFPSPHSLAASHHGSHQRQEALAHVSAAEHRPSDRLGNPVAAGTF